eukprot:5997242-Amphidinium_carterae.2
MGESKIEQRDLAGERALSRLSHVSTTHPAWAAAWHRILCNAIATKRQMSACGSDSNNCCILVGGCGGPSSLKHYPSDCTWVSELQGHHQFSWLERTPIHTFINDFRNCEPTVPSAQLGQLAHL